LVKRQRCAGASQLPADERTAANGAQLPIRLFPQNPSQPARRLFFAEHGFAVEAIDGAAAGLDFACREAAARGLRLSLRQADADALPFADESFDYVLSWNVIFHGTMGDVGRRLAEIWRVLKLGGLFQGTMLSKRDV
jgi:SAM-dependent methyltransferase